MQAPLELASPLVKPLVQPHPQGAGSTKKRNHELPAYRKGTPNSNLNKMKWQKNIQQVKKHDKCPPNQTKEEEIGSLPEKEFRIMIVQMIQNFKNKMESQINRLETRIEKM